MITMILLLIFACFFAINIGASGAAATLGIAYGSGAVKKRTTALILCGVGVLLGAVTGGSEVVRTIGSGIIPESLISTNIALIILVAASISLFLANLGGIPLSTSEVTVGAIVGVGISYQVLFINSLTVIIVCWLLVPFAAFILAYATNKCIRIMERKLPFLSQGNWPKILALLVLVTGFLEAFSAGMNNVANAIGPVVAAGLVTIDSGILIGGIFVALGAILLGGNVIETNGKRITNMSLLQGSAVSGIGAGLVMVASIFGIPVPHTQVTTCSIMGVGVSDNGREIWKKNIMTKLVSTWVLSPLLSLVISYNMVEILKDFNFTGTAILLGLFFVMYLLSSRTKEIAIRPLSFYGNYTLVKNRRKMP
ncbi:anion permease [Virgibacillus kekensis]|uniref:Phosphate transporter n=1 Tax=Virgibacillus kekensis TaxID=202261 RepID=A0ABV9DLY1_9BACI